MAEGKKVSPLDMIKKMEEEMERLRRQMEEMTRKHTEALRGELEKLRKRREKLQAELAEVDRTIATIERALGMGRARIGVVRRKPTYRAGGYADVLAWIKANFKVGDTFTYTDVVKGSGYSYSNVWKALTVGMGEGWFKKLSRGQYQYVSEIELK